MYTRAGSIPSSRSPWMRDRVAELVRTLSEEHGLSLPPQIARAEISAYLTTCASVFHMSRLDARQYVTDQMLRESAWEIAAAYRS